MKRWMAQRPVLESLLYQFALDECPPLSSLGKLHGSLLRNDWLGSHRLVQSCLHLRNCGMNGATSEDQM